MYTVVPVHARGTFGPEFQKSARPGRTVCWCVRTPDLQKIEGYYMQPFPTRELAEQAAERLESATLAAQDSDV